MKTHSARKVSSHPGALLVKAILWPATCQFCAEQGLDQELVHRIDLARFGRHAIKSF